MKHVWRLVSDVWRPAGAVTAGGQESIATPDARRQTPDGAAVVVAIVLGATLAQALHPTVVAAIPGAPWNWLMAGVPALLLLVARWRWPDQTVLRLLGSSSWAVASLLLLAVVCVPMAVWPTGADAPAWLRGLGLGEVTHSLPFAAVWACLVASLATVTGLRLARPAATRAWLRSVAVHLGLLIAAVGAVAAAGTLEKGRLILKERGEAATSLLHEHGQPTPFPVAVTLDDFRLESFAPTVAIAARHGDDGTVTAGEVLLGPDARDTVAGWQVTVEAWLPACAVVAGTPQPYREEGAGPAARVVAMGPAGAVVRGWLHAPTVFGERLMLMLPDQRALVMADPRPKRFSAAVRVDGQPHEVAVNQPLHVPGWTLYLTSYDESLGAASNIAILEAVRDPALPGVYLGLGLLLLGMAMMLTEQVGRRATP